MAFRQMIQEESRGGVTMRVHRYVEKKMVARGLPTGVEGQMHYIAEPTDVHQLEIFLWQPQRRSGPPRSEQGLLRARRSLSGDGRICPCDALFGIGHDLV